MPLLETPTSWCSRRRAEYTLPIQVGVVFSMCSIIISQVYAPNVIHSPGLPLSPFVVSRCLRSNKENFPCGNYARRIRETVVTFPEKRLTAVLQKWSTSSKWLLRNKFPSAEAFTVVRERYRCDVPRAPRRRQSMKRRLEREHCDARLPPKRLFREPHLRFSSSESMAALLCCCFCDSIAIHAPIMSQSATSEAHVKGILQSIYRALLPLFLSIYGYAESLLARIPHNRRRFIACQFPPLPRARAAAIHHTWSYFNFIHRQNCLGVRRGTQKWFVDF